MLYDLIIVGMGPAGSVAATRASELGLSVLGLEKAKMPRNKPCGGGVLSLDLPTMQKYVPAIDLKTASTKIINSSGVAIQRDDLGEGGMVIRSVFDHQLFENAKRAGAIVRDGARVKSIAWAGDQVDVTFDAGGKSEVTSAKVVLGADGVNSLVARTAGLKDKWETDQVVLVYVNETEVGKDVMDKLYGQKRQPIFHFGWNTYGYGWVFPKTSHVNVGFGGMMKETMDCRKRFGEYVEFCQKGGLLPEINPKNTTAALVPMTGPLRKIYAPRLLLAGDAASFVNPISGEGIQFAIRSGHIAAEAVAGIIKDGDFRIKRFKQYQIQCMAEFGKKMRFLHFLQKVGYRRIPKVIEYASKDERLGDLLFAILLRGETRKTFEFGLRYLWHSIFG